MWFDIEIFNYGAALFLVFFGIFTMAVTANLIRKVIGMVIMQSGVILFFISLAYKTGAKVPILLHHTASPFVIRPEHYANPLPHALMLTAIVVGVSLLGVALVIVISLYEGSGTLEEDEILKQLEPEN